MYKLLFLFILLPAAALGYNPSLVEPEVVYEPVVIDGDLYEERNLLGDLKGAPDLFEFSSDVAFTFTAQLKQRSSNDAVPFGLLLVRQNDTNGGVIEIARQNIVPTDWSERRYISLGMTFLEAPVLQRDLTPGTYRIEVSTPDNEGEYMLVTGEEGRTVGPWAGFKNAFVTQYHFGVFPLLAVLSPYVAIPLLILLSLAVWFKRKWDSVKL